MYMLPNCPIYIYIIKRLLHCYSRVLSLAAQGFPGETKKVTSCYCCYSPVVTNGPRPDPFLPCYKRLEPL